MQTVFNNSDLCHVFAQQSQEYGKNAGETLFFEDKVIYSYGYHYPMAKIIDGFALVNSSRYSNTTAKQTSFLKRALYQTIIEVPNPKAKSKEDHIKNMDNFFDNVIQYQKKASRARTEENRDLYDMQSRTEVEQLTQYVELFKIKPLKKYRLLIESNDLSETTEAEIIRRIKAEKRAKAKLIKAQKDALKDWKKGKRVHIMTNHAGGELLRIKGESIETSKGIKLTFEEGERLFKIVNKVRGQKEDFKPENRALKVNGYYSIDYINTKGDLKAGCHFIKWEEIKETAKKLNWI